MFPVVGIVTVHVVELTWVTSADWVQVDPVRSQNLNIFGGESAPPVDWLVSVTVMAVGGLAGLPTESWD
jgi:hypothetical protein